MRTPLVAVALAALLAGCSSSTNTSTATTPDASSTATAPPAATEPETTAATTTTLACGPDEHRTPIGVCRPDNSTRTTLPPPVPPTLPPTTAPDPRIRAGTYIVGAEFAPGVYRVAGYWARLDAAQEIIDNESTDDCTSIMVVDPTDAYVKISGAALPLDQSLPLDPTTCEDGTFIVGLDIMPGEYRVEPIGGNAYWARLDETLDIIDNDISDGQLIVVVREGDFALYLSGTISPTGR